MIRPLPHFVYGRRLNLLEVFSAFLFLLFSSQLHAQHSIGYNTKAVFLYNFTRFVEWPEMAFASAEAPFVIGILGDDPFKGFIDETVNGERAKSHPIIVKRYWNVKEIKNAHILFICNSQVGKLKKIMQALPPKYLLTVSDIEDFAKAGGMIGFITRENKIKLQVNLPASSAANLHFSSKLLKVAEIVK